MGIDYDEPGDMYAFVDAIHENDPRDAYARVILHLDCVQALAFDASDEASRDPQQLALVRVITTWRAMWKHFGVDRIGDGEWLSIRIQKKPSLPRAWLLPAAADYRLGTPLNLVRVERIGDGDRVRADLARASCFMQAVPQPKPLASAFQPHAARFKNDVEIIALDVGQASSAVFRSGGKAFGFFDVGAPIWFNQKSMPTKYRPPKVKDGFVMLSHWDFDHIDQARRFPELRSLDWFAPDQTVGPNTVRLQEQIGSKLTFVHGSASFGNVSLSPGTSVIPNDRNGTGYAMRVEHNGEVALLLGDSDYQFVQPGLLAGATAITIPHHGGRGTAPPRPAGGRAIAIASYGKPNSYRHPYEPHLDDHDTKGWTVSRTATSSPLSRRGNRRLI